MFPSQTDVLIVGAGPAGLAAAIELKRLGVRAVAVVDREPEAGGTPRLCHHTGFGLRDLRRVLSGPAYAQNYRTQAERAGVQIYPATTITAWRGPTHFGYTSPSGVREVEARAVLLATGCRERPRSARLVPGTRPQGIFTTGSLQRFVYEQHLPVGRRAVIVGAELVSLSAVLTLQHARVAVPFMLTELPQPQIYFPFTPARWLFAEVLARTQILPNVRVTQIFGRQRVEGVEITHPATGQTQLLECDTVVFTGDWIPEHELARLGGLVMDVGTRGPQVDAAFRTSRRGVFAAGNLLRGAETADTSALEGRRAAYYIQPFLQNGHWPEAGLPLVAERPLSWLYPNALTTPWPKNIAFRSQKFCDNVHVQVHQGPALLHSQPFRRLIVNETMHLKTDWLSNVNPNGEPARLSILNP
ncbi:MAG: NAD(P)/FAD-dependent oxidoreductase [Anaerolineales bacterium]|nr:NAD(P)/FAD-dependent oxidoreductase [Anaerolineales bacterium]